MTTDKKASIEKFSTLLETLKHELKHKTQAAEEARTISQEAPPATFDPEAAGRAVAQARVADLMNGGNSADAIATDFERKRVEADKAVIDHEKRQARARKQFEEANNLVRALTAQALEIDAAIRREFAAASQELLADAEQALAESAIQLLQNYINYKAVIWLRFVERQGDRGKQFSWPDQYEVILSVPSSISDRLPDGFHRYSSGEEIVYEKHDIARLINERVNEIMGAKSGGLYPRIAAELIADADALAD